MFINTKRVGTLLLALVFAALVMLSSLSVISAEPANNGTLKVHEYGTPSGTENNDPKVCKFRFEGFGFDKNQTGLIKVDTQPGGTTKLELNFGPTNNSGYYATEYINNGGKTLANGQYKTTLYGKDKNGNYTVDLKAKSKVFQVVCEPNGGEKDYYMEFEKKWTGDKVDQSKLSVVFKADGGFSWELGDEPVKVDPGKTTLTGLDEVVTGLPRNCSYESDLVSTLTAPSDLKKYGKDNVYTHKVTNKIKCDDNNQEQEYYFQFNKLWDGDEVDLDGVEVTFYIGDTAWQPGDEPVEVEPGDVLEPLTEKVTGLPTNCSYTSTLPESYEIPESDFRAYTVKHDDGQELEPILYELDVTNTVTCDEGQPVVVPETPVTPVATPVATTPTALPATGSAENIAVAAASVVASIVALFSVALKSAFIRLS